MTRTRFRQTSALFTGSGVGGAAKAPVTLCRFIVLIVYGTAVSHPLSILDPVDRFCVLLGISLMLLEQSSGFPDHPSDLCSPPCQTCCVTTGHLLQHTIDNRQ